MLKRLRNPYVFSFLAGSFAALAMAPLSAWPVLFVSVSVLYVFLNAAQGKKQAFLYSWLFAFGYFLFSLSWIGHALLVEGNGYQWAYPLAVSGIPFLLACFWGVGGLVFHAVSRRGITKSYSYAAFVFLFSIVEFARGTLFTGFPWNLFGYSWVDILALVQSVKWVSIYGLTGLTFLWAALPGFLWVMRGEKRLGAALVSGVVVFSFAGVFVAGQVRLQGMDTYILPPVNVKLVPGHVAQKDKWDRTQMFDNFLKYIAGSYPDADYEAKRPTLIIWPETVITDWFYTDTGLSTHFRQMLQAYDDAVLLSGVLRTEDADQGRYYNSLVMIGADGKVRNIYDKTHLVPFGEYIPFQDIIPLRAVSGFSGFVRGRGAEIFETPLGVSYAPGVCYEIIFPYSLIPKDVQAPDFIVNVTNDAWYEGSAGPYQHYVQVVFRAVEYGIPVIRAANKGISAMIDPYGRTHYFTDVR